MIYSTMKHLLTSIAFFVCLPSVAEAKDFGPRLPLVEGTESTQTSGVNWPTSSVKTATKQKTMEPHPAPPFRILVDVGHGGYDFGASGHFGILEKQICLSIAARVKASLERAAKMADFGLQVRLSRESDHFISLRDRARVANEWGADLFLSIHANSSPVARARGFEVYFLSNEATDAEATRVAKQENAEATTGLSSGVLSILSDLQTNVHILESSQFAEVVYTALSERLRANGRGVRQAPFSVLSGTQMPALLIEVGYLTNEEETRLLMASSYQRRVASALAKGVLDFALRQRRFSRTGSAALGKKRTT